MTGLTVPEAYGGLDIDGLEVGKKEDTLGLCASDTTTLLFDDVRDPAENV